MLLGAGLGVASKSPRLGQHFDESHTLSSVASMATDVGHGAECAVGGICVLGMVA
jgi:hypothetical protein